MRVSQDGIFVELLKQWPVQGIKGDRLVPWRSRGSVKLYLNEVHDQMSRVRCRRKTEEGILSSSQIAKSRECQAKRSVSWIAPGSGKGLVSIGMATSVLGLRGCWEGLRVRDSAVGWWE